MPRGALAAQSRQWHFGTYRQRYGSEKGGNGDLREPEACIVQGGLVAELEARYPVSRRKTCAVLAFPRSSHYYRSCRDPQEALRVRLRDLARSRVRYGYRRFYVLLRRENWV